MKEIFDKISFDCSKKVTKKYSTSFYLGVQMLDKKIRPHIHAIYGFVRFADEIVDTFHGFDKEQLLTEFRNDTFRSIKNGISLNPILNSFQTTVNKYNIDLDLIDRFLISMEMDLRSIDYTSKEYEKYIFGSAEVVGLMCLKVFVYGDNNEYLKLKPYAQTLGSAFQKVNFLRDIHHDYHELGRIYFPNMGEIALNCENKRLIETEIEKEFETALNGIKMLPKQARLGVYLSFKYYEKLLIKIQSKSSDKLLENRIRISNNYKLIILFKSYFQNLFNLI
jgi:phytoene/squalene synthetase